MIFVFDVDGTLTPSSDKIDEEFKKFFIQFCRDHEVYLTSGSDYLKTTSQVGEDVAIEVDGVFSCAGNVFVKKGEIVYEHDFDLTDSERLVLEKVLEVSTYPVRTGRHIEKRIGLVNFSVVGRNADMEQRKDYVRWDELTEERKNIVKWVSNDLPRFDVTVAGETGVDIYLKGKDKGQIVDYLNKDIIFFGDKCFEGGNDYSIAKRAKTFHHVKNWQETLTLLQDLYK